MEKYHLIGIGGIGMSGLARILQESNVSVSGSDFSEGQTVHDLEAYGIKVFKGHSKENIPQNARVVYSSGISLTNCELAYARDCKMPLFHRSELLNLLMGTSKPLLVTGSHGKTTTSSLLTHVLIYAGKNPSYALGGILKETNVNGKKGKGEYFVAEADESDGSFIRYHPFGSIITNIGHDHMDYYQTEENLLKAFKEFANQNKNPQHLFYCGDNALLRSLKIQGISYGFTSDCTLKGLNFSQNGWKIYFDAFFNENIYKSIEVSLSGYHNALNALSVFGLALSLGIEEAVIREAFKCFQGVKRRCEIKMNAHEIQIFDDYAHHPTEIKSTLSAIKKAIPDKRLILLFQPHRYTRTRDCLEQFFTCFDEADEVFLTDIYAANESPLPGINSMRILEGIKASSSVPVCFIPKEGLLKQLLSFIRPFDVVVTMGAGDIWQIGEQIVANLENLPPRKIRLGLIYGGKSKEHEISIKSAKNISKALDPEIFDCSYFFISKKGVWCQSQSICQDHLENLDLSISQEILHSLKKCDIAFPVLHGPNGEDGTIQGFFEILNLPYIGCNHQSSAICMDKAITKKIVEAKGLRVAPFLDFSYYQWDDNRESLIKKVNNTLPFPLYVKPVHLGSTFGVKKVENEAELENAIDMAFKYDTHVLVEKEIKGREIEFAVFGDKKVRIIPPGEVLNKGKVYDYEAKYGINSFDTTPKATLSHADCSKGMEFAKAAYIAAGCDGLARVDCFFDENNEYYLNEINPIPGFTENSLYPKMCLANGFFLPSLLKELAAIGFSRDRLKRRLL